MEDLTLHFFYEETLDLEVGLSIFSLWADVPSLAGVSSVVTLYYVLEVGEGSDEILPL